MRIVSKIVLLTTLILGLGYFGFSQTTITLPYGESFESGIGDWTQDTGDDIDLTRRSGGTPSNNTGPSGAHDGSFYMYTEASGGNQNSTANFDAVFDFTSAVAPQFSFYYHMYGANMGTLRVLVDGTEEFSISGQQQTSNGEAWTQQQLDLTAYAGSTVTIRFEITTGTSWRSDAAMLTSPSDR